MIYDVTKSKCPMERILTVLIKKTTKKMKGDAVSIGVLSDNGVECISYITHIYCDESTKEICLTNYGTQLSSNNGPKQYIVNAYRLDALIEEIVNKMRLGYINGLKNEVYMKVNDTITLVASHPITQIQKNVNGGAFLIAY